MSEDIQRNENGDAFKISAGDRDQSTYPGTYEFGMFAGLVVELGGYNDVELVDPYTGSRFWFQPKDHGSGDFDLLDAVGQAVAEARKQGWGATAPEEAGS